MTSIEWTRGDDGSEGKTWNPVRGLSDDEAEALVHAVDRWTEAKWAHIRTGTAPAWATVRERAEGRNLHG